MINFFLFVILSVVGLFGFQFLKKKRVDRRQHKEFHEVFDQQPIKPPTLKIETVYWWPTFTVTFFDKSDYEYAKNNGLFETFNSRIQKFYDKEFRAELAVTYKWTN
jgi:hypothetical protein